MATVALEIDGGRKAGTDYTNIILEGNFIESFCITEKELKDNVITILKKKILDDEKSFNTLVVSISNDNCVKIDAAAHQVCQDLGKIHTRCSPHTLNLTFKDLILSNQILTRLMKKILDITKILMNRKEEKSIFGKKQLSNWIDKPGVKPKVLILKKPGDTRWTSKTVSWERFLRLIISVEETLAVLKYPEHKVKKLLQEFRKKEIAMATDEETKEDGSEDRLRENNAQVQNSIEFEDQPSSLAHETDISPDQFFHVESSDEENEQESVEKEKEDLPYFGISAREQEQYHNYYYGLLLPVHNWINSMQADRWSLLEQLFWYKEARYNIIAVQKWDTKVEFFSNLKSDYHKTVKEDLQAVWLDLGKILEMRSGQFNDKVMAILEDFLPMTVGVKHSYDDHKEVVNCFLGNVLEEDLISIDKVETLFDVGPRIVPKNC